MEYDFRDRFGRYYEDFEVGDLYKHWPGKTINEHDNDMFCLMTMNHMPLHLDLNYAQQTQHGQRLVVGLLVLAIGVGISVVDTSGRAVAALDYEEVKHVAPTFIGDTIYSSTEVLEKRLTRSGDRGIIKVAIRIWNQRGETVMTVKRSFMVYTKAAYEALDLKVPGRD